MTTALIFNPAARHSTAGEVVRWARDRLQQAGEDVQVHPTRAAGDAVRLASELRASCRRLVAVGGDGTLREIAAGLGPKSREVELGLIPYGNANVLARELGIPLQPKLAVDCLLSGHVRNLDAGRVNEELFLAMVGVGFDAEVVDFVHRMRERPSTRWLYHLGADFLYAAGSVRALLKAAPVILAQAEDGPATRCYTALICNTATYAKGWSLTPTADPADGRLDYLWMTSPNRLHTLTCFLQARHRRGPQQRAVAGRARWLELSAEQPLPYQVDGDPRGRARHLRIEVLPGAYRVVAP